ncbi:hypothetical protein [Companilactobacillus farciminis]|uniref:hypothetical protein n=1 Tax=Companilactobacillus farciminis TaxID=1612 RepID=UPI001F335601|nr:hypothetical protein [Companilactobacillus farciminis]
MQKAWQKNFRILWFGSFITDMGNAMTLPFVVLFIDTLGDFSQTQLNFFRSGSFFSDLFNEGFCFTTLGALG